MLPQSITGDWSERETMSRIKAIGLEAEKPRRDVGVDLEVRHPARPAKRLCIQVKARGTQKTNTKYRWFQIRTTKNQRDATVAAGLPVNESWRKKVALCQFFVLASKKHDEFWVVPSETVCEMVLANRVKHGKRPDNVNGEHAELDLDIDHNGKPLTELYTSYKNNFSLIAEALNEPATR
jgi:hypothetical protein